MFTLCFVGEQGRFLMHGDTLISGDFFPLKYRQLHSTNEDATLTILSRMLQEKHNMPPWQFCLLSVSCPLTSENPSEEEYLIYD